MAARQNFYAAAARQEINSGSVTDLTGGTITFTPDADSTYWVLCSIIADAGDGFDDTFMIRLQDTTNTVTLMEAVDFWGGNNDIKINGFAIAQLTYGASPPSQTIKLQAQRTAGTASAFVAGNVLILKAHANDKFAATDTVEATQDAYETLATLAWTPPSTDSYLMFYSLEYNRDTDGSNGAYFKLASSGGDVAEHNYAMDTLAPTYWPLGAMIRQANLNGAQSYTLQGHNMIGFGLTTNYRRRRILALWMAGFEAAQYAESLTRSTYNTDTTDQDKVTLSFTPAAVEHVVIAAATVDESADNVAQQSLYKHKEGVTVKAQTALPVFSASSRVPIVTLYRATLAAASTDFKISYATENVANTVGIANAAIAALQTGAAGGGGGDVSPRLSGPLVSPRLSGPVA